MDDRVSRCPARRSAGDPRQRCARRLAGRVARYVAALGREQLTILVIEDVHWASGALLDLLEQLAETSPTRGS